MKNEEKKSLAQEAITLFEGKKVSYTDMKKIFSSAYHMVGDLTKNEKPAEAKKPAAKKKSK